MTLDLDGLVLVGGKSSRMGEPKAWLSFGDMPQWQACEQLLKAFCQRVYFSCSPQLVRPLPVDTSRRINDIFSESCGPLGGIISAFHHHSDRAFFILACDMPHFKKDAVDLLVARRNKEKMATVFCNERGEIEPLCGIYEPAILNTLMMSWQKKVFCPRKILFGVNIEKIPVPDEKWLSNCNHRADIFSDKQKKLKLHFYAQLREEAQCENLEIETRASNLLELFSELKIRFNFSLDQKQLRFAKNHHFVDAKSSFDDGDLIVLIPPVSGG